MIITRELLIAAAKKFTKARNNKQHSIICVFLGGSTLHENPLLGNTTDIDLFFVHSINPEFKREIVPHTESIHFDITHYTQADFRQPRDFRGHPWIAPFLCQNTLCLYDTRHWFEYVQASICSQYDNPEYIASRFSTFFNQAREQWMNIYQEPDQPLYIKTGKYIQILELAANSFNVLTGLPVPSRKFLLEFEERTTEHEKPGLYSGFLDLFLPEQIDEDRFNNMVKQWETCYQKMTTQTSPAHIYQPCRMNYYLEASKVMFADQPEAAAWILIRSWSDMVMKLASPYKKYIDPWEKALKNIGITEESMQQLLSDTDQYLDFLEETFNDWKSRFGLM